MNLGLADLPIRPRLISLVASERNDNKATMISTIRHSRRWWDCRVCLKPLEEVLNAAKEFDEPGTTSADIVGCLENFGINTLRKRFENDTDREENADACTDNVRW